MPNDCTKGPSLYDSLPSCTDLSDPCREPNPPAFYEECTFTLCDGEKSLFQCWADEHISIAGTNVKFFHLDIEESSRDPLYDEAIERVFMGSYLLKAFVEYPEATPEAKEEGLHKSWDASLWIPTSQLSSNGAPTPAEGDIIQFWDENVEYFKDFAVLDQDIPGVGYLFDIIKVSDDGHLFDQAFFVGFKCTLKRKTEFTAERRIAND